MKTVLYLFVAALIMVGLGSCGDDPNPKQVDVYLGGNHFDSNSGVWQAACWKNGELITLSTGTGFVEHVAASEDGKDYYAFGYTVDDPTIKTLWKNGVATDMLDEITEQSRIHDMAVYQGDTYLVGYSTNSGIIQPVVWVNGVEELLDEPSVQGGAYDVVVYKHDIYIVGWNYVAGGYKVVYWKNGVKSEVTPTVSQEWAYSIAVSGENIYLLGEKAGVMGVWKNGVFTALQGEDPGSWEYPGQLAVRGSDVYVVGNDWDPIGEENFACYWKNGVRVWIENTYESSAIGIVSSSKGVLAIGYVDGPTWYSALWNNWELAEPMFSQTAQDSYVESMAIAEY